MDKIVDYLESFKLSLELSGYSEAIQFDVFSNDKVDFLVVRDQFIYNVGTIIKMSFNKTDESYHIVFDKHLQRYAMGRYSTWKFSFDREDKMLNVLEHFIKIIEEQFVVRSNK